MMNYFEVFELPVQMLVDKQVLKKKYFELSRRFHPDYFVQQDEAAQQDALEQSALINKAFKTFTNRDETIKYVLELKGLLKENEKYNLPPDFLMEMMELNERLADAQFDPNERIAVQQEVLQMEALLYDEVKNIIENYQDGVTTHEELQEVKDYYFKKKYLERLKQQLGEKL